MCLQRLPDTETKHPHDSVQYSTSAQPREEMRIKAVTITLLVLLAGANAPPAVAQLEFSPPFTLTNQSPDLDSAYKAKLVRLKNGALVVVYSDTVEDNPARYVYDLKAGTERAARDVFVRTCNPYNADCASSANWSAPLNISNTALLSSIDTDWNHDGNRTPYHGDSENPHIFAAGSHVVVAWVDKYCPGDAQRAVVYLENDSREIAMGCVYAAHNSANPGNAADWTVDRLSDGSRDPKQDNTKGLSSGAWAITWQEDPLGLQPGEAEGPGEGSSGAKVSHGTDIWYTWTTNVASAIGTIGVWQTPVRLTDNHTGYGLQGSFNPLRDANGDLVPEDQIEKGIAGASRANLNIVGGSSPPTAVVAWEETKGSAGLDEGKLLRYHAFAYNNPPTNAAGCIISDPAENARRARFVRQTNPASGTGLRWAIFWRQGTYTQGGPADVMLRLGYNDMNPANLVPPVDPNCAVSDYASAISLNNAPALNLSSNTPTATSDNLTDATGANNVENARAHRAVLRANDLYVAWIYTPDWAVAEYTDLENYDYYVRHYSAGKDSWSAPLNLSNLDDNAVNVKEPRLVGTPGSGPKCADTDNPVDARDCQNKAVVLAAWGTETNVYSHLGGAVHLNIYVTRTGDKLASLEPVVTLAGSPAAEGESQLRMSPDGSEVYVVWNEDAGGAKNSLFALSTTPPVVAPEEPAPPDDEPPPESPAAPPPSDGDVDGTFGCTLGSGAEPLLALLLLVAFGRLVVRRRQTLMIFKTIQGRWCP